MLGWWGSVWSVAVFFLGGVVTYVRDLLNEKRRLSREREAREAQWHKAVRDRREQFELEHLQRLNEALQSLGHGVARAHHADLMASHQTGRYASTMLGDELGDAAVEANRNVTMLKYLVLEERLRDLVSVAHAALNVPGGMRDSSPDEAEAAFARALALLDRAQAGVAERIRSIYLPPRH